MTLEEALDAEAAQLDGVEAGHPAPGATEWSVGGRPFAVCSASTAEFRLAPVIARAALGTPDTAPSQRGPDWIAFSPREFDRFALDRATAWLASARRHIG